MIFRKTIFLICLLTFWFKTEAQNKFQIDNRLGVAMYYNLTHKNFEELFEGVQGLSDSFGIWTQSLTAAIQYTDKYKNIHQLDFYAVPVFSTKKISVYKKKQTSYCFGYKYQYVFRKNKKLKPCLGSSFVIDYYKEKSVPNVSYILPSMSKSTQFLINLNGDFKYYYSNKIDFEIGLQFAMFNHYSRLIFIDNPILTKDINEIKYSKMKYFEGYFNLKIGVVYHLNRSTMSIFN